MFSSFVSVVQCRPACFNCTSFSFLLLVVGPEAMPFWSGRTDDVRAKTKKQEFGFTHMARVDSSLCFSSFNRATLYSSSQDTMSKTLILFPDC